MKRWFPVARREELSPRHVVHTQLLSQELAVWRDDAGGINAWENRCPHRGVRLSIGTNTGSELQCRYHGWRFASGSGRCSFIPAHPTQKPASTLRPQVYPVLEHGGHVWVALQPVGADAAEPPPPPPQPADGLSLRSLYVRAPAARIAAALLRGYRLVADQVAPVEQIDEFSLRATLTAGTRGPALQFWLQPMSASATTIHGCLDGTIGPAERLAVLRHHNTQFTLLREESERFG